MQSILLRGGLLTWQNLNVGNHHVAKSPRG
jgi:hypothetical protein